MLSTGIILAAIAALYLRVKLAERNVIVATAAQIDAVKQEIQAALDTAVESIKADFDNATTGNAEADAALESLRDTVVGRIGDIDIDPTFPAPTPEPTPEPPAPEAGPLGG